MKSKILYFVSRLRAGGPSTQLKYIIQNISSEWDPIVLTLSPEDGATARPTFEDEGIPVQSFELSRYGGLFKAPMQLRQFCRDVNPTVVHSQGIRPDLLSALFLNEYPRVVTLRNYAYEDYPAKYGTLRGYPAAMAHLAAVRRVDVPVACSYAVQQKLSEHRIETKVIQNGVDTQIYQPANSKKEKKRIRRLLGLPENRPVFISVGFLIPRKDPQLVIRGFQESQASKEGVLVMLGDGPLLDSCREQAEDGSSDIRLPGYVENVASYLQAADFFVSASHSEGLPNTVMEALASGLPVVLSDIQSHREVLDQSSRPSKFFKCGNLSEMAKALNSMLREDREDLQQAARKLAESQFTASSMSEKYQALYREVGKTVAA